MPAFRMPERNYLPMQAMANHNSHANTLRSDVFSALTHSQIDPDSLSTFQRVILTADGTLTPILEAYLLEKLQVLKVNERIVAISEMIPFLDIPAGQQVIERKIFLQGKQSGVHWLYAESLIVLHRLHEKFREDLLSSREPIGTLWLKYRVETFKEIVDIHQHEAAALAGYFKVASRDNLLSRTYRVFSNQQPIMLITEKFPQRYFA